MRRQKKNQEPYRWDALATFNAEKSRGIVHTPEWEAKMAAQQAAFNLTHYGQAEVYEPQPDKWIVARFEEDLNR